MVLRGQGRSIEVVNQAENGMEDVVADLTSILSSFCARLYGQRRAKRKTEQVVQRLEANGDIDAIS
jgi:predicted site-specific integrase-resolvase